MSAEEILTIKTAYEWAKEFGLQILDPDGFGERYEGRPHMDELMDMSTFNKCMVHSTIRIIDPAVFRAFTEANND